jgi:hypothetical protein
MARSVPDRETGRLWSWSRALLLLLSTVAIMVLTIAALGINFGGQKAIEEHPMSEPPATAEELNTALQTLFTRVVTRNGTHFDRLGTEWAAEAPSELRTVTAMIARSGPISGGEGFDSREAQLAFRINAYNTLVMANVAEHWPITSVHDVHGVIDPSPGFGFFYGQFWMIDGGVTNLYDFESVIARSGDARIHAVLNCASASCPPLSPTIMRAETLEVQLAQAAERFASEAPFVEVDHEARTIRLSQIYEWHHVDFEGHARRVGTLPTVLAWIRFHARPRVRPDIERADVEHYTIEYVPYDWTLSRAR